MHLKPHISTLIRTLSCIKNILKCQQPDYEFYWKKKTKIIESTQICDIVAKGNKDLLNLQWTQKMRREELNSKKLTKDRKGGDDIGR